MAQGALACTPGVAGSGPHGDPYCMGGVFEQERMMQGQSSSSSGGGSSYTSDIFARLGIVLEWGAIAFRPDNSVIVAVNDQATERMARESALQKCGYDDCKVVFTYKNAYAAVAIGEGEGGIHAFFYSDGNANVTKSGAMNNCEKHKIKNCRLYLFEKSFAP